MRLIASDIDGTIADHHGHITPRTVSAFKAAAAAGIEIVFVTGRPPRWLDPIREQIGHTGTVICSNGAVTYSLEQESVISSHVLNWETVTKVRSIISELVPDSYFALEGLGGFHVEEGFYRNRTPAHDLGAQFGVLEEAMAQSGIVKMLAATHTGSADLYLNTVAERLKPLVAATHSAPEIALLELGPLGVNKAVSLAEYTASLGIEAQDVIAFGDMPNDIEMLAWAGSGYAMESGHQLALAATELRAPALADDGVAQVIEARLAALEKH